MEANPFPDLKLSSWDFLDEEEGRRECSKCHKSRKYYCYTCYCPVVGTEDKIPHVQLPVTIDVIKHPGECDGKSTAAHAGVLAPDHVKVYTYPVIPDYTDKDKVILIFPGQNSVTLADLVTHCQPLEVDFEATETRPLDESKATETRPLDEGKATIASTKDKSPDENIHSSSPTQTSGSESSGIKCDAHDAASSQKEGVPKTSCGNMDGSINSEDKSRHKQQDEDEQPSEKRRRLNRKVYKCPFNKVVFIDSTWNQTKKIYMDERLKGLKQVELKTQKTKFWRHQRDKPETYLATIEAIYYFLREYHEYFVKSDYIGQYDNLLFFFCFLYQKIKCLYDGGKKLKAYPKKSKS